MAAGVRRNEENLEVRLMIDWAEENRRRIEAEAALLAKGNEIRRLEEQVQQQDRLLHIRGREVQDLMRIHEANQQQNLDLQAETERLRGVVERIERIRAEQIAELANTRLELVNLQRQFDRRIEQFVQDQRVQEENRNRHVKRYYAQLHKLIDIKALFREDLDMFERWAINIMDFGDKVWKISGERTPEQIEIRQKKRASCVTNQIYYVAQAFRQGMISAQQQKLQREASILKHDLNASRWRLGKAPFPDKLFILAKLIPVIDDLAPPDQAE